MFTRRSFRSVLRAYSLWRRSSSSKSGTDSHSPDSTDFRSSRSSLSSFGFFIAKNPVVLPSRLAARNDCLQKTFVTLLNERHRVHVVTHTNHQYLLVRKLRRVRVANDIQQIPSLDVHHGLFEADTTFTLQLQVLLVIPSVQNHGDISITMCAVWQRHAHPLSVRFRWATFEISRGHLGRRVCIELNCETIENLPELATNLYSRCAAGSILRQCSPMSVFRQC